MEDPTPCGGIYECPNGTECRGEWEVRTFTIIEWLLISKFSVYKYKFRSEAIL